MRIAVLLKRWVVRLSALCLLMALVHAGSAAFADTAPSVTTQPQTVMLAGSSDNASFAATADGSPAPTVQWQYSTDRNGPWTSIDGATNTTLNVTAVPYPGYVFSLGNAFRAVFTNAAGTAFSRPARLVWRTEWMRDLGSDIASVPLNELTIPGAHDMGTYGINGGSGTSVDGQIPDIACDIDHDACVRWGEAQNPSRNATAELDEGIRYFDLRVCSHGSGDFVTCHGLNAADLQDILTETRYWIDAHPYEVVILDFNHHFQTDVEVEAGLIEQAFAVSGGGSLLIPPQYCAPGNPDSGTCANLLTLSNIASTPGRVIVNFANDDAASSTIDDPFILPDACAQYPGYIQYLGGCIYYRQPPFGLEFYNNHPLFWGRTPAQPTSGTYYDANCTLESAFTSCFGNDSGSDTVLGRIKSTLGNIGSFADTRHFFVQFLQTTPDTGFILSNFGSSLDQMAGQSNPLIGPAMLGCDSSNPNCFYNEFAPENLNILPINFYNDADYHLNHTVPLATVLGWSDNPGSCPLTAAELQTLQCDLLLTNTCTYYDPVHFDYVEEVLRFDEYARTAPVVEIQATLSPASTGWYNAAVLGGQGHTLVIDVNADDYWYPTGFSNLSCQDNIGTPTSLTPGTNAPFVQATLNLGEGQHALNCSAADGARFGFHGHGNQGAGPGSTPQPVLFNVDTVGPSIHCQNPVFILHQPAATVGATVTDETSGPQTSSLSAAVSTNTLGTFSVPFIASDVAGNSTTGSCSYTVTYGIALQYNTNYAWASGNTVPIRLALVDYYGTNLSSKSIPLTAVSVTDTKTAAKLSPTAAGGSNTSFVFYPSPNGYLYTLSTKGYTSSSYTLDFVAPGDPVIHHAPFLIR